MMHDTLPIDMCNAALEWARKGDWLLLALVVGRGEKTTPEIGKFLFEVLVGKRKRPNNRAPTFRRDLTGLIRAHMVMLAMRDGAPSKDAAINQVLEDLERIGRHTDRRTIQRDLRGYKNRMMDIDYFETLLVGYGRLLGFIPEKGRRLTAHTGLIKCQ
jgi:hypothetical protein